ncbi:MAG: hypothetical protein ACYCW6_30850, partial [Candidatus Xenobia bacterium]
MSYPGSIDTIPQVATGDIVQAGLENSQTNAILAVENTLGINPQGGFPTVAALLASTITAGQVQSGTLINAADTGSSNA